MDVVIVGAGLAGLRAAQLLVRAGVEVVVLEAGARVGGRVASDHAGGFTLDRGFQVYNTAYPEGRAALDLDALRLCAFRPGVEILLEDGGRAVLDDPREGLSGMLGTAAAALGGRVGMPWQLAALAGYAGSCATLSERRLAARPDVAIGDALRGAGIRGGALDRVVAPFLAGVLGDESLTTSRRYVDQVLGTFVRGRPSLPAAGMAAIPAQLAGGLPAGTVRLGEAVRRVGPGLVAAESGELRARAVVVATEAPAARDLLPGLAVPSMRALTTWYFATRSVPVGAHPRLLLDGRDRRWLANAAVLTDTAAGYGRDAALVAASAVGHHPDGPAADRARRDVADLLAVGPEDLEEVARYPLREALPALGPGDPLQRPVVLGDGVFVVGDHRQTPSIQGALASGHRGAAAVLEHLGRPSG